MLVFHTQCDLFDLFLRCVWALQWHSLFIAVYNNNHGNVFSKTFLNILMHRNTETQGNKKLIRQLISIE